jgi:molecular chaperone DnaJ
VKQISANGKRTKVKFPAGVANGAKIRVKGRGAPGRDGGTAGDLFVRVQVADHPLFRRSGSSLTITVPVTFTEAALGADIQVPTLDGSVTLRVPPGTGSGKKFRVREQGFTKTSGGRGDLLVTVEVVVPDDLSAEEEKLLVELSEHGKDRNPRSHLGV